MTDHTPKENEITLILTKAGATYTFRLSDADEPLTHLNWNIIIGRNGHVYAHRTEKGKKVYLARQIKERELRELEGNPDRVLVKGENVFHKDNDNLNKTRDNLGLKVSKKLQRERDSLNNS
jgi:hypothetical protein